MLKKIIQKDALTLTELLVSSMLMGIVMIGIAGFSVGIKRMQDSTDKSSLVSFQVAVAMAYLERTIAQTYGSSADAANPSFFSNTVANPRDYWSFRADPNRTPTNSADDVWNIFWRPRAGQDTGTLFYCQKPYSAGDPSPNIAAGQNCSPANVTTVIYRRMPSVPIITWVANNSPSTLDQRVDISVVGRLNPAAAADPLDNPTYTMTSSVALLQYSNTP